MNAAPTPASPPDPLPPPPWLAEDLFPPAPGTAPYGYRRLKQLVPCSYADLDAALRADLSRQIALVWTPMQLRLTPPEEVPFLAEAMAEGERRRTWQGLRSAALQLLVWVLLIAFTARSLPSPPPTYLLYLVAFGLIPLAENSWGLWRLRTGRWTPPTPSEGRFRGWMLARPEHWSLILIGCVTLVGAVQLYHAITHLFQREASSVLAAGLVKPAIWSGELWRLMTGPLLHGNPIHFIFNLIALLVLGKLVETLISREALAVTFVLAALAGSLFSLLLLAAPSVGASGGIMGLLGLIIMLGRRRRGQIPPPVMRSMLVAALLIAATGLAAYAVVDNAAHLGGFLAGLCLGWWLIPHHGPIPTGTAVPLRQAGWGALALVVIFSLLAILVILRAVPPYPSLLG